ncbi:hypothetical protein MRB53_042402 [Persea americana]|nr:hypothetical protein MRB53_042402 [Persea americana]
MWVSCSLTLQYIHDLSQVNPTVHNSVGLLVGESKSQSDDGQTDCGSSGEQQVGGFRDLRDDADDDDDASRQCMRLHHSHPGTAEQRTRLTTSTSQSSSPPPLPPLPSRPSLPPHPPPHQLSRSTPQPSDATGSPAQSLLIDERVPVAPLERNTTPIHPPPPRRISDTASRVPRIMATIATAALPPDHETVHMSDTHDDYRIHERHPRHGMHERHSRYRMHERDSTHERHPCRLRSLHQTPPPPPRLESCSAPELIRPSDLPVTASPPHQSPLHVCRVRSAAGWPPAML